MTFQSAVHEWMLRCFGSEIADDKTERSHRFLEEALELVQAAGTTREEAMKLVDYVFDRPVGELHQEVGGTMVTLAALCRAHGISMDIAGEVELQRCWQKIDKIRAKQAAKPKFGPLPGDAEILAKRGIVVDETAGFGSTEYDLGSAAR
jgi:NTP pyrophosphatase (non-canonical NTP hydrolase)